MKYLLLLVILVNCLMIQGVLEWTVVGKVTDYGQSVTLFCNVSNCCPKNAGWDRLTPVQRTLFIDLKTGRPNKKYDGKVLKDGYTLIIQNLTKQDLNVSYSCVYGATIGDRKFLLEEDVFTFITQSDVPTGNSKISPGEIGAIITIIIVVIVIVSIFIYFGTKRSKKQERNEISEEREIFLNTRSEQKEIITKHIKEKKKMQFLKRLKRKKNVIPRNIRDQIKKQIEDWEKNDKMFVSTRASDYVMEQIHDNSCLTLIAPPGVGKSFIARHTALVLKKEGYNIIPVDLPAEIKSYYQSGKQTVFIVDDICGNFTANQQHIDNWKQLLPVINTIIADKCCKIIVSCRLQVYKDEKFKILPPFKSCECNLISDKLCLTSVEKNAIAKTYIGSTSDVIDKLSLNSEFFPLLCSLYDGNKNEDVNEFFKNPFNVYREELDNLSKDGDEGILRICCLALCVIFDNQLEDKWFKGKLTEEQKRIIEDICDACEINRITSKAKLKKALDTLEGTFICKQNSIYRTVHDKLYDFLAHYFGQKMIECLIDHGDSGLVRERFIWQTSPDDEISTIDFIIEIPYDNLELYLNRLIKDWSAGNVTDVLSNINMKVSSFRKQLLQYLQQLDKPQQVTLANIKDAMRPKKDCASGNTPLVGACYYGFTDIVHWLLRNNVDGDQCRDDGFTGLIFASQEGHTDIIKLLLERNPKVDLCANDGHSPLYMASLGGHTDIVKLLLVKNPNVDLCDNNNFSPLLVASHGGHTDIVKLLLERNPNVDLCENFVGFTPLIMSCIGNHTSIVQVLIKHKANINAQANDGSYALHFSALNDNLEITQYLLENNADCNMCMHNKQSMINAYRKLPKFPLDTERQPWFNSLFVKASSSVKDYISQKTVDYGLDVVADSSPLHIACFLGKKDTVNCLLDNTANINIKKEDGTTPLFYACEVGHEDIVRSLLDKGADTQICRLNGKSPLDIATDNEHISIVMMLKNYTKKEDKLSS